MSIENPNIEQQKKVEQTKQKNALSFSNIDKLFSDLQNKDHISKTFFTNQVKEFQEKTGEQWEKIVQNLSSFLEKHNLNDTKSFLATLLLVEQIIDKKWEKANLY